MIRLPSGVTWSSRMGSLSCLLKQLLPRPVVLLEEDACLLFSLLVSGFNVAAGPLNVRAAETLKETLTDKVAIQ